MTPQPTAPPAEKTPRRKSAKPIPYAVALALAERLRASIVVVGDCWEWQGTRNARGYGAIYYRGRKYPVHRVAYCLANGSIAPELMACHRCDNPPCCNPAHLFLGTHKDNAADMVAKGRSAGQVKTHCKHGHSLLSDDTLVIGTIRVCRECRRACNRARRRRIRERRGLRRPRNSDPSTRQMTWDPTKHVSHCHRGHAYTAANTRLKYGRWVCCRECEAMRSRMQRARRSEGKSPSPSGGAA